MSLWANSVRHAEKEEEKDRPEGADQVLVDRGPLRISVDPDEAEDALVLDEFMFAILLFCNAFVKLQSWQTQTCSSLHNHRVICSSVFFSSFCYKT